ncbi:MAG: antibiotic biosynthesis monooxygenase [Chloroflexaceae bacterium]|nr:antibiotic biosynthesis monooxygenase [Chloroflexaceae bacterium]
MIVLVAHYRARTGQGDAVAAAMQTMVDAVKANEPGCLLYHLCRATDDSDSFLIYEQYADEAALEAHRNAPHFQAIILDTVVPLLESRERTLYHLVAQ